MPASSARPRPATASRSPRLLAVEFPVAAGGVLVVVESVDLQAAPGELVCLAGRSGSGKTSILRMLVGLAPITRGVVAWGTRDVATMSADELADLRRTEVAYLDQSAELVEELSVVENVVLPVIPDGRAAVRAARRSARDYLKDLALGDRFRWRPPQLSGGERQRVALVRTLVTGARGLLADEPTASLDRATADLVVERLRRYADEGGTVVVASHDPAFPAVADQTVRLEEAVPTDEEWA